ncbi:MULTISPECIES: accessory Sec system translocase SecA2 [unclassified Streptococcus]|uniref:accessory Sec system translocase SecA2 n=1 Tax=unclassified Streptococcus TaxID=2608887 RepID=UPI001071BD04|nr:MULTISPECIES: accessory Sec system translocase SecA2 [unclassified Streptococcus]MBF0805609.1 accessory Sec system translocase SecA2 [Streptococcus sp. 19428wA2_WM07]TFU28905.1 accessory Sec system translocase SecA2 [Streptococcus sp. WM07]
MKERKSLLNTLKLGELRRLLQEINDLAEEMEVLTDQELGQLTNIFRQRLQDGEQLDDLLVEAFAAMREASRRVLGLFPFDVQIMGAIALHQGYVAEMKTGEGKTLTATLPLYLNALENQGAILVTTNDYLARRDAQEMGPVFEFMGLSVGVGVFSEEEDPDVEDKRAVYAADVTYTTSTALGFDYLADNLAADAKDKFLRPFHYVIVDEADAVLLDAAQTPLIISGSPRVQSNLYHAANQFVLTLQKGREFQHLREDKAVFLTQHGIRYAQEYFDIPNLYQDDYFELNRHIQLALRAHHLYKKDIDYVVADREIKLLDNRTGRVLEGTRLQSGIHQALEAKEEVPISKDSRSVASVTYQSLFNMFPRIAGMTGTGKIAEDELIQTYKLPVVVIPTNLPIQRVDYPDKIYVTLPEKLQATLEYVKELHQRQQPILLISGTVDIAEIYSRMLLQEGIPHSVLTAKNVAKEAQIIKEAGQLGAVTVATSLAGRGTDIKLGTGVAELGGLAVIGTERMPNSRIDWQLRGRAGRQGDPGLSQFFVSLEDELVIEYGGKGVQRYFEKNNHSNRSNFGEPLRSSRFKRVLQHAQEKSEDNARSARQATIRFDESLRIQREKIYHLRDELIYNEIDLSDKIDHIFLEVIRAFVTENPEISNQDFRRYILENYSYQNQSDLFTADLKTEQDRSDYLWNLYQAELAQKSQQLETEKKMEEFLRLAVLRAIDEAWIEQVDTLQQLKNFVPMRQLAQRDSTAEYFRESLESYNQMTHRIKESIVRHVMLSSVESDKEAGYTIYFV